MTVTIPTKAQHDAVDARLAAAEDTLAAATAAATPGTVARRDVNGDTTVRYLNLTGVSPAPAHAPRRDYVDAQDAASRREPRTVLAAGVASYTLALADEGDLIGFSGADTDAKVVVVPANAAVPFPVGGWVDLYRSGAHTVTVSPATGVTVLAADGNLAIRAQNSVVRLLKVSADGWLLAGDNNDAVAQAVAAATKDAAAGTIMRRDEFAATNVAILGITDAPTAASHAVRKDYADALGTAAATANTIVRRDGHGRLAVATGAAVGDAANVGQLALFGRDRGAGTALPTTDLRRGDVFYVTSMSVLWAYNGAAWRATGTGTVADTAALGALDAGLRYEGLRCHVASKRCDFRVWNLGGVLTWRAAEPSCQLLIAADVGFSGDHVITAWEDVAFRDNDGMFDKTNNRVNFAVPGRYRCALRTPMTATTTGHGIANRIVKNGTGVTLNTVTADTKSLHSGGETTLACDVTIDQVAGDWLAAMLYTSAGAGVVTLKRALFGGHMTSLTVEYVGPTLAAGNVT